jgi:hypothetical protein
MSIKNRARAAGRKVSSGMASTGLAMAGGGVYFGAHTLLMPSIIGTDASKITSRAWWLPVAGVVSGHLLSRVPKAGAIGLGLAGGATAIGIEQIQFAMQIKKQQAAVAPAAAQVGALLEPSDIRRGALPSGETGYADDDAGALWMAPVREAAGLSL